jgi:hypothetical protein
MLVRLVGCSSGRTGERSTGRRRRRSIRAVRDPLKSQEMATAPKVPTSSIRSEPVGTLAAGFALVGATEGASDAEYGSALTSKLAFGAADAITSEADVGPLAKETAPDRSGQRAITAESTLSAEAFFDRLSSGTLRLADVVGVDRPGFG